mmetsp:Transcript_14180/g.30437  ORF Transcript_14180/g.30437 Transcript_14180/m.30437 type:complete len:235 (-) Transcript_14180:1370-2074(-)
MFAPTFQQLLLGRRSTATNSRCSGFSRHRGRSGSRRSRRCIISRSLPRRDSGGCVVEVGLTRRGVTVLNPPVRQRRRRRRLTSRSTGRRRRHSSNRRRYRSCGSSSDIATCWRTAITGSIAKAIRIVRRHGSSSRRTSSSCCRNSRSSTSPTPNGTSNSTIRGISRNARRPSPGGRTGEGIGTRIATNGGRRHAANQRRVSARSGAVSVSILLLQRNVRAGRVEAVGTVLGLLR